MDKYELVVTVAVLLWAAAVLVVLWRKQALASCAFMFAPRRGGSLNMGDVLIAVGLWMVLPGLVVEGFWDSLPVDGLRRVAAQQGVYYLGTVPLIGFILWRAHDAVDGGWRGLGIDLRSLWKGVWLGPAALFVVLPLVSAAAIGTSALLLVLGHEPPKIAHDTLKLIVESPRDGAWWALVLLVVLAAPFVEELLFRGMTQTALRQSGLVRDRWVVVACTAFVFAWIHAGVADPSALPQLYVLGLGLGWVYERWGNLWAVVVMHALFNATQIAMALYVVQS